MSASMNYLDGNAAAGELSRIFAADLTSAQGKCAYCGATRHFAEAQLYVNCPGFVARCSSCGHVLLRLVNTGSRILLDVCGMSYMSFDPSEF